MGSSKYVNSEKNRKHSTMSRKPDVGKKKVKTKNWRAAAYANKTLQDKANFKYEESYPGIGGFSLLKPIVKTIDKLTGYKRTKDTDFMDIGKVKQGLEMIKYGGKGIPKTIKIGDKRMKNLNYNQPWWKTLID